MNFGELTSTAVCAQEQRIIDDLVVQESTYILNKNDKKLYFAVRKRPLVNPSTQNVVGILVVALKVAPFYFRGEHIKQAIKLSFSKNTAGKISLSEQQQQIVYCLLLGFHSRKEIAEILSHVTDEIFSETRIKKFATTII